MLHLGIYPESTIFWCGRNYLIVNYGLPGECCSIRSMLLEWWYQYAVPKLDQTQFWYSRLHTFNLSCAETGIHDETCQYHDDVFKWKHFPRYWPFVRGIHRSPVNSPHKGQWRGTLIFSLICVWINGWVNNREAGDLRRHRAHYDVIVMPYPFTDLINASVKWVNNGSSMACRLFDATPLPEQTLAYCHLGSWEQI